MQPNFWPDMGGGGLEQVGAAVAVDELLMQSHEGFLVFFPAWERGKSAASFENLRARGAFLASAAMDSSGRVLPGLQILSEVGTLCKLVSPWNSQAHSNTPPFTVKTAGGAPVQVSIGGSVSRGIPVYSFHTEPGTTYVLNPVSTSKSARTN
jgi:hypothetical protein